jgi:hypothetical protein
MTTDDDCSKYLPSLEEAIGELREGMLLSTDSEGNGLEYIRVYRGDLGVALTALTWQPIETAPTVQQMELLVVAYDGTLYVAHRLHNTWMYTNHVGASIPTPRLTHWMLVPKPPAATRT